MSRAIKNWQDESEYAYLFEDNIHPHQFTWEFVRRNPEYQAGHTRFLEIWKEENKNDPPVICGGVKNNGKAAAFGRSLCEKFGITDSFIPTHPNIDACPTFSRIWAWTYNLTKTTITPENIIEKAEKIFPSSPCEILVKLDLRLPLNTQIKWIEANLRRMTKDSFSRQFSGIGEDCKAFSRKDSGHRKQKKSKRMLYVSYIRILDALGSESKPAPKVIYYTLYKDLNKAEQTYKNHKTAAIKLRDEDFLHLAI